jgi:ABC-2 type transport system ATP-binding protein
MDPILEMTNVSKSYKDFSLKNINLSLERGCIMGFIGPNGAGKSTTIKLIMNLVKKDSGVIKIFGLDNASERNDLAIKERIGFVYDENHFYEELTVQEMKNVIRPFYSRWDEGLFTKYVKDFNLPMHKPIKQLSKGMKMKFSLAVALSHHAELFIMDEPTSGLDPLIRNEFLDILQSVIQDEDKSVFFSTHITSDLDKIADFITIIHNGEILLSATKDELLEEYCIVKGGKDILKEMNREHLIGLKEHQFGFEALARNKRELMKRCGNSAVLEKPTLEEIMLYSIRGETRAVPY